MLPSPQALLTEPHSTSPGQPHEALQDHPSRLVGTPSSQLLPPTAHIQKAVSSNPNQSGVVPSLQRETPYMASILSKNLLYFSAQMTPHSGLQEGNLLCKFLAAPFPTVPSPAPLIVQAAEMYLKGCVALPKPLLFQSFCLPSCPSLA